MKRLAVALAILVLLLAAALANASYLMRLTEEIAHPLTLAETAASGGDWSRAQQETDAALAQWSERKGYLYTVLRHSDTDAVHVAFREVQRLIACENHAAYAEANAALLLKLELLGTMEQFNLENLL